MDKKRIFIFVPGTNPREALYYLSEDPTVVESACYSTVALIKLQNRLLKRKPDLVMAFCTEKVSKDHWPKIQKCFVDLGVKLENIPIPNGENELQLNEIIKIMLEKLQEDCYLTLDLTHGLRSCPIVFSVAVQYIKFLRRKIEIEGFYYGMLESKNAAGASPIVNLQVYLDLMEWIYAVRIFRDTRTTSRLIEQFERITESSKEQIITNLQEFNKYYELAAPIKLGETAASLGNDLRDHLPPVFLDDIPLGVELAGEVAVLIGNFSSTPDGEMGMTGELDILELERQGRIVDVYFETGQINHAVGLVREWIVSALLYHNGNKAKWRQRDERSQIEKQINNKHENDVNNRWNHVRKLRNELHHHGMQDSGTYSIDEAIELVKEDWEILKDNINNPNYWILKFERCSK